MGLFSLAMLALAGGSGPAGAVDGTGMLAFAEARWLPLALIGGVFSLVLAFNLALYRHVSRVYAAEQSRRRPRSGRSGSSISP